MGFTMPPNLADKFDIYRFNYNKLRNVALSAFVWEGLPKGLDSEIIERQLFSSGTLTFFKRDDIRLRPITALPWANLGRLDIYGEPTKWWAYGHDGFRQLCFSFDSVICYYNKARLTGNQICQYYAYKLAKIEKEMMVNVNMQKFPVILKTTKKGELTAKNFYAQVKSDNEAILVYKDSGEFDPDGGDVKTLNLNVPVAYLDLQVLYNQVMNQFLTDLGINNSNQDKRERQITGEVEGNMEHVNVNKDSCLSVRKQACEKMKAIWGTNVQVRYCIERLVEDGDFYYETTDDSGGVQ